jgi:hypothetical protein
MIFMAGYLIALNISRLVILNPSWEPAWWKVIFCGIIALFGTITIILQKGK